MGTNQKKVIIRAIPAGHHEHRHCVQRPWSRERVTIKVVDNPKPPTVGSNDGKVFHVYHDEISPAELEHLKADPHIVVCERVDEMNAQLAKLADLRTQVAVVEAAIDAIEKRA